MGYMYIYMYFQYVKKFGKHTMLRGLDGRDNFRLF